MRKVLALVRASWLTATSYRFRALLSIGSLLFSVIPIYYVAKAIQPVIGEAIATQGEHYFSFLLVGMVTFSFLSAAVNSLPGTVGSGIATGTLEALLGTPTRLPTLLAGLVTYSFLWTALRAIVLLGAGLAFGVHYAWGRLLPSLVVLLLIVLAYVPIGIIAAAFVLAFRSAGPIPQVVVVLSGLLGGVYYPTHVIPEGIQKVSDFMPLTYGLRALRRTLLEGQSFGDVSSDLAMLLLFVAVLMVMSVYGFTIALRYARRAGTLAQY